MKRLLSVIICLMMLVTMFSACTSASNNGGESTTGTGSTTAKATEAGNTPNEEPVTISIFGVDVRAAQGYALKDNLWVWEELGKRLNLKFEFHTSNNYWDLILPKLNSGQELEDLYCLGYENPGKFIDAGLFLPLDDYIAKSGPNIAKVISEDENYRSHNISLKDNKMYTLSETTYRNQLNDAAVYTARKDWLDKLNLKAPQTIDEFYDVCMALKKNDPNKNGKDDEIPFMADGDSEYMGWLGMSFGLHLLKNGRIWADDSGKVYDEVTTENYKSLLMFMNKLYKNKIIPGDIQTMTWETAAEYSAKNIAGLGIAYWGGLDKLSSVDPEAEYLGFYAPSGPYGPSVTELPYTQDCKRYAITKYCKHPEAVIKLLDYLYSDEGWLLYMYGIEGEDYTMVNGEPVYTDKIAKAESYKAELEKRGMQIQCVPLIYAPISKVMLEARPKDIKEPFANINDIVKPGLFLNKLLRTTEENAAIENEDIKTFIEETDMAFITGTKPFSEWDQYQAQLVKLGINDITAIYQTIYDRNYKN